MKPNHVIDLHEDLPYYIHITKKWRKFDEEDEGRPADIPEYKKTNVRIVFTAIFPLTNIYNPRIGRMISELYNTEEVKYVVPLPSNPFTKAVELINTLYQLEHEYNEIGIIRSRRDLTTIFNERRIGFIISLEGSEALSNPSYLDIFYKLCVRAIGITWNYDTKYGASCQSKRDYGLTGWGEELIREMNKYGIIIDAAHSSKKTILDILEISKMPIIISHSNYKSLINHPRNVDDEILEKLSENRGVIGFTLIKSTLGKNGTIEALAKHIKAVYDRFGGDILAIGTDYYGIKTPEDAKRISALNKLWIELSNRGLSNTTIEKIAWKNAYRVIERNSLYWHK